MSGGGMPTRVWHGRPMAGSESGQGVFLRGGGWAISSLIRQVGGKWHYELRGWTMTAEQFSQFRLCYKYEIEDLAWEDFVLTEWQGREYVQQGPRVHPTPGSKRTLTVKQGGYQRPQTP